jgi:DNA-binding SARP family transcriptional activator
LVGGRAFTLGQAEAAELLAVVAAGRGTHPAVPPEQSPPESPGLPAVPAAEAQVKTVPEGRAAPDERSIRVRLFGPLRIELDGAEVRTGLRIKSRELLAFLLLHPDGVGRETAIEALWPDMDPARSSARAKDALRSLRQALQGVTGQAGATVVELIGDRLRVNPALVDADVWRFQAALVTVAAAADDQARLEALTQAAAAYGGTLLEGADYDWAEAAREEFRRQAADLAGRLGELREQAGDLDGAIAALEDGARWDTFNEELHQRIMRLQARLGRLDAVRRTYTRLQERLADLGADPDEATERLLQELRRGGTTRR